MTKLFQTAIEIERGQTRGGEEQKHHGNLKGNEATHVQVDTATKKHKKHKSELDYRAW